MDATSSEASPSAGQQGLEEHYAAWFGELERDFRGASLNRLIAGYVTPGRVLDLGCGSGGLSAALARRGCTVTSQDVSPAMVEMCRRHLDRSGLPADRVRQGRVEDVRETEAFDTLVTLDVIEHIADDRAALATIHRAIVPSGELILSVPALSRLYGPKDEAIGHFRRYDRPKLLALVREAGFEVTSVRYWNAIGLLPVWYSVRIAKRRLDESVRYAGRSKAKRALNSALSFWFQQVENSLTPPLGLTLIVRARRS